MAENLFMHDPLRLVAVRRYPISPAEPPDLEDLTCLARRLCEVPVAFVRFFDERPWYTAVLGMDSARLDETACGTCFLDRQDLIVVEDGAQPEFPFYAAVPLVSEDHFVLGRLAVMDRRPRSLDEEQRQSLRALGRQVMAQLNLRLVSDRARLGESKRAEESEARYRALFDYAPDGIVVADQQSNYLDGNEKICQMLGYTREEFIGLNAADIVVPSEVEHIEPALDHIQCDDDYRREWRFRRKDGSEFPADVMAKAMPDGNLLGVIRDISAQKRADEALRSAEERMRFALDSAGIGIWDLNIVSGELSWSHWLERQHGFERGTFPGTLSAFRARIHPDDREMALQAAAGSGDFTVTNRVVWPDGTVRWLRAHGRVYVNEKGERVRSLGISQDITEQRQLEEQFQQSQKMEAVGRLAGGVAHDFNNLLTIILGFSALLNSELEERDPRRKYTAEIERAAASAATLTRQLLAFSRKQIVEPRLLDFNAVIASMEGMLSRLLGEDVEVILDLATEENLWIRADRSQLEQVVLNLAVNARDAMPQGGRLHLQTRGQPAGVRLQVRDTGTGIAEEVLERIFEPFFTTKEIGQGTGLGLATVHGIVTQSGGSIQAGNGKGGGACFEVCFPRAQPAEPPGEQPVDFRRKAGPCSVLVVDDAEGVRNYVQKLLERHGFSVFSAASGMEALRLRTAVDILLTDVVMPQMSGPELAQVLCRRWPGLEVVYMSGYTEEDIVERGTLRPGIRFIQKPFDSDTLLYKLGEIRH